MQKRKQIIAVYAAGLVQGLALVTFPAISAILTSPTHFHLSNTQYGGLFIPQAVLAIVSSLMSAKLTSRQGVKPVFLYGLTASFLAMLLLIISALIMQDSAAYLILLLATASLGVGFGLVVPLLNTLAASLFPKKVGRALLALNALLGTGTALGPLLIAVFIGLQIWWGLPLLLAVAVLGLIGFGSQLLFKKLAGQQGISLEGMPPRFWMFALFALVYGMIETMNGNWATTLMKNQIQASISLSALALAAFWVMITLGRVFFAALNSFFSEKIIFQLLPLVAAIAFFLTACVPVHHALWGVGVFALAGLGCSAFLPLTISFADQALPSFASSAAGGLIAFYLLGYGISAFTVGPLQDRFGFTLSTLFGFFSILALILSGLACVITRMRTRKSAAS